MWFIILSILAVKIYIKYIKMGGFYSNDRMEENALVHAIDMLSTFEEQNKIFPENNCLF